MKLLLLFLQPQLKAKCYNYVQQRDTKIDRRLEPEKSYSIVTHRMWHEKER